MTVGTIDRDSAPGGTRLVRPADCDESRSVKSLFRRVLNRVLGLMTRLLPGATTLRPFLHRLRGVRIEGRVFIGDDVYLENEYPESIELQDGCQLCVRTTLIAHTGTSNRKNHGRAVWGRIVVEKDAFVGATSVLTAAPGQTLTIGQGAVVTASSVIATDVPRHTLVGTDKARVLAEATVPLRMETPFEDFLAGLRPFRRK